MPFYLRTGKRLGRRVTEIAVVFKRAPHLPFDATIASACNLLDVQAVIIGGGLGTRLGEEYALRIEKAMLPHLFVDHDPPGVHVAALGDLGGAIGAALLVPAVRAGSAARGS